MNESNKKQKTPFFGVPFGRFLIATVLGGLLGGLVGAGLMMPSRQPFSSLLEGNRENMALQIQSVDTGKLLTQAEVYARNVNSTVGITTETTTNFWGYQTTAATAGSGFVFTDDGYILTNYHVVGDTDTINVAMYDGSIHKAELIGFDEGNDVAVLKIEAKDLVPVVLGNSDNIYVGDPVVAIGNPLGELTFTLTSGSISAKEREITMSTGTTMRLMQTDCAINSGNSGGALFNLYGEVIGITNAKYSGTPTQASIDNIGFAIPINKARAIAVSIIEKGHIAKPYIGVSVVSVTKEAQGFGLPQGAAVMGFAEDSPAKDAGLQVNDIITHIDGKAIAGNSQMISLIADTAPGDKLNFTVYRKGETLTLTVTVGEKIQQAKKDKSRPPA